MRSLIIPADTFCFEQAGIRLSLCHARKGADVQQRGGELAVHEARQNLSDGSTKIIALINHPAALLQAASFIETSPRLYALSWDIAAFAQELRAADESQTLQHARSMIVLAARAAGILAFDSAEPQADDETLRRACLDARRNGFDGKLAATAAQQATIEAAFA